MKTQITIEIDTDQLTSLNDRALADRWCVAQANPAPLEDDAAGDIAEAIGREIIRRWLKSVEPELWRHQGKHAFWHTLQQHGKWLPVNGDDNNRQWTPNAK